MYAQSLMLSNSECEYVECDHEVTTMSPLLVVFV